MGHDEFMRAFCRLKNSIISPHMKLSSSIIVFPRDNGTQYCASAYVLKGALNIINPSGCAMKLCSFKSAYCLTRFCLTKQFLCHNSRKIFMKFS